MIPIGYLDRSQEKVLCGQLPARLMWCVDNRAFNGDLERNPFNYKHFSLSEISACLDGLQHGVKPLSLNVANNRYISGFISQFTGTGKDGRDVGNRNCINRSEFANGYGLYVFDPSPDLTDDDSHFNLSRQGTVRLNMKFAEALANTATVVI